jgi:hypothetical protein
VSNGWVSPLAFRPAPARRRRRLGAGGDVATDVALLVVALQRRRRRGAGGPPEPVPAPDGIALLDDDPRRVLGRVVGVLAAALLVGVLVLLAGWATGWRSHDMTTPSMGRAAPVGTIVVSRPVELSQVHVGQIIVFHPPGRPGATYAHRVAALVRLPTGTGIETKGDINGTRDPWVLGRSNLVGRVALRIPDGGFVVQALPWLILGLFVILLVTSGVRRSRRLSVRIGGLALLVSGLVLYFRPLERIILLSQSISRGRGAAVVVPSGVLPLRVHAPGGSRIDLTPGQVGVVRLSDIRSHGLFEILSTAHLFGWWWLMVLFWTVPIVAALAVRRDPPLVGA